MFNLILFDRDGVLNKKAPEHEYVSKVADVVFYEDCLDFFKIIRNSPFVSKIRFAVVTNQQGVSLGRYSERDIISIHKFFLETIEFNETEFPLYFCPHLANSCICRKPSPYMILKAIYDFGGTQLNTVFVGDAISDMEAAMNAGISGILLDRHEEYGNIDLGEFTIVKSMVNLLSTLGL